MQPQNFTDLKPNVVLGIGAHPDDIDFGSGGTMAYFAKQGADVYYLQLTNGDKGSADPDMTSEKLMRIREEEQLNACKVIGGKGVRFLRYPDGALEVTQELKKEIVKVIRELKPDVVITMDPSMLYHIERSFINHPDHRAAGQATLDAVFPLARDRLTYPDLLEQGYEPWKVKTVLMTNFANQNFYIDTTETLETKFAALKEHASQIPDFAAMKQMFTQMAEQNGGKIGRQYAEGFLRIDTML